MEDNRDNYADILEVRERAKAAAAALFKRSCFLRESVLCLIGQLHPCPEKNAGCRRKSPLVGALLSCWTLLRWQTILVVSLASHNKFVCGCGLAKHAAKFFNFVVDATRRWWSHSHRPWHGRLQSRRWHPRDRCWSGFASRTINASHLVQVQRTNVAYRRTNVVFEKGRRARGRYSFVELSCFPQKRRGTQRA